MEHDIPDEEIPEAAVADEATSTDHRTQVAGPHHGAGSMPISQGKINASSINCKGRLDK